MTEQVFRFHVQTSEYDVKIRMDHQLLPSRDPLSCGEDFLGDFFFFVFWALQGERRPTVKDILPQRGVHAHAL